MNIFQKLRTDKYLTINGLAEIFKEKGYEVDRNKINRIEGKQSPDGEVLKAYSDYFCVTADFLLGISQKTSTKEEKIASIGYATGLSEAVVNDLIRTRDMKEKYEKEGIVNLGGLSNFGLADVINLLVEHGKPFDSIFSAINSYFRLDNESPTLFTKKQTEKALKKKEFNLDDGLSVNDAYLVCNNGFFLPLNIAQIDSFFLDKICDQLKEIKRCLYKDSKKEG